MRFSDKFREIVMDQHGYFTVEQAYRLNNTSRKQLSRLSLSNLDIENVEHGIYRTKLIEESAYSDIIIMGLKANGKAAISHKSALSYWEMSDETPYKIYMKAFDGYLKKDIRSCKGIALSTKGESLLSSELIDYVSIGEVYVTSPTRTLFDCVMDFSIQIESVAECMKDGRFNKYNLSEDQLKAWDNHDTIKYLEQINKNNEKKLLAPTK